MPNGYTLPRDASGKSYLPLQHAGSHAFASITRYYYPSANQLPAVFESESGLQYREEEGKLQLHALRVNEKNYLLPATQEPFRLEPNTTILGGIQPDGSARFYFIKKEQVSYLLLQKGELNYQTAWSHPAMNMLENAYVVHGKLVLTLCDASLTLYLDTTQVRPLLVQKLDVKKYAQFKKLHAPTTPGYAQQILQKFIAQFQQFLPQDAASGLTYVPLVPAVFDEEYRGGTSSTIPEPIRHHLYDQSGDASSLTPDLITRYYPQVKGFTDSLFQGQSGTCYDSNNKIFGRMHINGNVEPHKRSTRSIHDAQALLPNTQHISFTTTDPVYDEGVSGLVYRTEKNHVSLAGIRKGDHVICYTGATLMLAADTKLVQREGALYLLSITEQTIYQPQLQNQQMIAPLVYAPTLSTPTLPAKQLWLEQGPLPKKDQDTQSSPNNLAGPLAGGLGAAAVALLLGSAIAALLKKKTRPPRPYRPTEVNLTESTHQDSYTLDDYVLQARQQNTDPAEVSSVKSGNTITETNFNGDNTSFAQVNGYLVLHEDSATPLLAKTGSSESPDLRDKTTVPLLHPSSLTENTPSTALSSGKKRPLTLASHSPATTSFSPPTHHVPTAAEMAMRARTTSHKGHPPPTTARTQQNLARLADSLATNLSPPGGITMHEPYAMHLSPSSAHGSLFSSHELPISRGEFRPVHVL